MKKTEYIRVLPRDAFNEAKLLKCIGQLCLFIHDRKTIHNLEFVHNGFAFNIVLLEEGVLLITNITFIINNKYVRFHTTYNSKSNYPLYAYHDYCEIPVFDDNGQYSQEFIEFCKDFK